LLYPVAKRRLLCLPLKQIAGSPQRFKGGKGQSALVRGSLLLLLAYQVPAGSSGFFEKSAG
jgi:hypothetical protein